MQSDIRLTTRSVVIRSLVLLLLLSGLSTACNRAAEPPPRGEALVEVETQPTVAPATWTPVPAVDVSTSTAAPTLPPPPTTTPPPTSTPLPATETPTVAPTETPTATPQPTNTPRPAPTLPPAPAQPPAQPTLPPNPVLGVNLLPNPSFEEGHYNQNGIPELQLPNGWRVEFTEGATGFGGQTWDVYVRPEIRVLSAGFLPESEHALYIFDGGYTVKLFKGAGAVNARLVTDVELQPGVYVLEASFFSDVFERYEDGQKFAPSDPFAGEAALFAGQTGTGWIPNNYLRKNTLQHTFKIDTAQKVPVGIALRGRYAIANNGWFLDNLFLRRVE